MSFLDLFPPPRQVPPAFRPALKEVKMFIPAKEYPGYNFIGLILGPRGSTQKRLENETGAKVTIRGKGSLKEGAQIRTDARGRLPAGWHEETHVHIAGDTWDKVDSALEIVEPLLFPVDEERNVHKRKQLLELARINGTVRPGMFENDNVGQLMLIQQSSGPLGSSEGAYRLPEHVRRQVDDQYRRDIARAKGIQVESSEAEYQAFLQELGGVRFSCFDFLHLSAALAVAHLPCLCPPRLPLPPPHSPGPRGRGCAPPGAPPRAGGAQGRGAHRVRAEDLGRGA